MLGYKLYGNSCQNEHEHPPWRRRLEAQIMTTRREVLEKVKGVNIPKQLANKYSKMSTAKALAAAKQRLMATHLKRYTREVETRRIIRVFSNDPSKVRSQ